MPVCGTCNKEIEGTSLNALGKTYHPEHFVCTTCKKPISDKFQTSNDEPYCSDCYEKEFLDKCEKCKQPIKEKVVKAMGYSWHPEHFQCSECKTSIANEPYQEKDGKAVCQKCYLKKYAEKCKGCKKPIEGKVIVALDGSWHPECFKCIKCKKPITDETFNVENGKPICSNCI